MASSEVASAPPPPPSVPAAASTSSTNDDTSSSTKVAPRKHPLQNTWTLWFFKNDRTKNWEENQREVVSFETVEDFWCIHNHIEPPSSITVGCDYSLFKKGIRPMWEDAKNKDGGRWVCDFNKTQRSRDLDPAWLEVLMCLIGEAFGDDSDDVCGCVVNIRARGDKIAVWTGNSRNQDAVMAIGNKLRERMSLPREVTLNYERHADTAVKKSSTARFLYQV